MLVPIFALVFGIIVILLVCHQGHVLQRLDRFADEALANRIIEAERLKSAKSRLELYDRHGLHMCVATGCRNPVVGKLLFVHCEQHLERYEKQWVDDKLESSDWNRRSENEHPVVKASRETKEAMDKERAEQNVSTKMSALAEARTLVDAAQLRERERVVFLPQQLRARIESKNLR